MPQCRCGPVARPVAPTVPSGALSHVLSDLDQDILHVGVDAVQPVAVIDHHGAAGEIQVRLGQRHDPARDRFDRRACRRRDVEAAMRRARLAVQDALAAIDARDRPERRPRHLLSEAETVAVACLGRLDQLGVGLDPGEVLLARRHLARRQPVDPLDLVCPRRNFQRPPVLVPIGMVHHQLRLRSRIAAEAEHEPALGGHAQLPAVQPRRCPGRPVRAPRRPGSDHLQMQLGRSAPIGTATTQTRIKAARNQRMYTSHQP